LLRVSARGSEPSVKPASYEKELTSTQEVSSSVSVSPAGFNEKIARLIVVVNGMIPALQNGFWISNPKVQGGE
jgi:hypothetical protein